jgi:hypothetical protein
MEFDGKNTTGQPFFPPPGHGSDVLTLILSEVRQTRMELAALEDKLENNRSKFDDMINEIKSDLYDFKLETTRQVSTLTVKAGLWGAIPGSAAAFIALIWWIINHK